jgi:hypothetical protein
MPETATDTAQRPKLEVASPRSVKHSDADEKLIVGYGPLAKFLTDEGFPTSHSTISKACSPAINTGPPVERLWGRLPAFRPSRALDWAWARLRPPDEARSRPATATGGGAAQKPAGDASLSTAHAGPGRGHRRPRPAKLMAPEADTQPTPDEAAA